MPVTIYILAEMLKISKSGRHQLYIGPTFEEDAGSFIFVGPYMPGMTPPPQPLSKFDKTI